MNLKRSLRILTVTLLMAMVVVLVSAQSDEAAKKDIAGVWIGTIQGRDCSTGSPMGGGGIGLITFAKGGTLSESSTIFAPPTPLPSPFMRGPGHGVWERHNWRDYSAAYILQRLNADGTFTGWTRLRGSIQLSDTGDEFSWTGNGEFITPAGVVFLTTCNTIAATRFK